MYAFQPMLHGSIEGTPMTISNRLSSALRVSRLGLPLIAALAWVAAPAANAQPTFCEENGLVVMEFESAPLTGDWVKETIVPQYTGSGYYRWDGPDQFFNPGQGILTFNIEITNPGNYKMSWRNFHYGPDAGEENDAWISMDGETWQKCFSAGIDQWNWHTLIDAPSDFQPNRNLSAGSHNLRFSGRSHNFRIDRVHLYLDTVVGPTNPAYPETDDCTWQDLGNALAGVSGDPALEGTGTLIASTPVTLTLTNAAPFAFHAIYMGISTIYLPFKGGTLVPAPDLFIGLFSTDASGTEVFPGTWPPGLPSGAMFFFQDWIIDPAGPLGFAASNALKATQP
jgi:hypothetical protein